MQGADPLAELARLIGQTDPLAEQSRPVPRTQQYAANDWRRHIERPAYETMADPQTAQHDPYSTASTAPVDHGYADTLDRDRVEPQLVAEPQHDPADQYAAYDDRQHHGGAEPPDQDIYDDPPRRKRSNGLVTAIVLIGCAMLGTAGAYGYRSYSAGSGGGGQAPVIVADRSPNKVVPAAATETETQAGRSQERFPAGSNERLVSREEQPVALTSPSPRTILPSPVQPVPAAAPPAPAAAAAPASPAPALPPSPPAAAAPQAAPPPAASAPTQSEPKRVRTVVIRSDGSERAPPTDTRSIPNARASAPPPSRQAPSRTTPLSLDPQAPAQAPVETSRSQRGVTPPAPRADDAPPPAARVAAVPPSGGNGGYVVQISSQRSEADAQASFRGLQAKYSQLRNRQPIIRRVDLGAKGTFYRAMVGPFGSSGEANEFCGSLKAAGGQCLIQRN